MEKWEDWRIALILQGARSDLALYWPVTSTILLSWGGPMEYTSRDPVGAGLNIWNFVKITLTLAGEPSLKKLIPLCGAEDCTRPVGGLLCCEVQPVGQVGQDGQHRQALAGRLEGGWVASASVASASS